MRARFVAKLSAVALVLIGAPALLAQTADLGISKLAPYLAPENTDVTYAINVYNAGPDDAVTAVMNDPLPPGVTFVSVSATGGFACSDPGVGNNGTVSCSLATFPAGGSADITIVVHLPLGQGITYTNTAGVSSQVGDPNPENDAATAATTTQIPQADVYALKNGPAGAGANTDVTYSITLGNAGPDAAVNAQFTDTLPGTMTFVSITAPGSYTCTTPSVGSGGTVTCSTPSLASGTSATFTLVGHVPSGTASGTTFSNTATASSATADANPDNDSQTTLLTVASADLSVVKSGPATITAGTPITWTITVANAGSDAATNTQWADALPAGTTFVSLTHVSGVTGSCSNPTPGTNGTVACSYFAPFPSGSSSVYSLVAQVDPAATGSVANTATVTSDTFDPAGGNNASTSSATVSASADLAVTKTGPATAAANTNVAYTLTIANNGPSDAANAAFSDTLPAGETFVSLVQNTGPAFSCATGATVTCTIASLPAGATATFTLTAAISGSVPAGTVLSNTVNATSSTSDPVPGNDASTAQTTTTAAAVDVSISKVVGGGGTAGGPVTYTITVTNTTSGAPANTVTVTDAIPAGTTFVSAVPSQGTCAGTSTVTCSLGTLAGGASATIQLTVTLPATVGATISNTASVTTSSLDPNAGNDSSTATLTVAAVASIPTLPPAALALMALALAAAGWVVRKVC